MAAAPAVSVLRYLPGVLRAQLHGVTDPLLSVISAAPESENHLRSIKAFVGNNIRRLTGVGLQFSQMTDPIGCHRA